MGFNAEEDSSLAQFARVLLAVNSDPNVLGSIPGLGGNSDFNL